MEGHLELGQQSEMWKKTTGRNQLDYACTLYAVLHRDGHRFCEPNKFFFKSKFFVNDGV